jgi:hypothetical protein
MSTSSQTHAVAQLAGAIINTKRIVHDVDQEHPGGGGEREGRGNKKSSHYGRGQQVNVAG